MIRETIRYSARCFQFLFLLFMLSLTGCHKSNPGEITSSRVEKHDQPYGRDSLQRFDFFLPEGHNQKTKVILLIHGGGWVSGNKSDCDYYAARFADFGFAAVSMNYRLADNRIHYREMLADIDSMISCISRNAGQWGISFNQVSLFGYSAGGHLALLYAYSADITRRVNSVISLAGPTDVLDSLLWTSPALYEEIGLMEGDSSRSNWMQANPVHFVRAANPATFLIHGTNDSVVPVSQSVKLYQMLKDSSVAVKLLLLNNEKHFYSAGATGQFLNEVKMFLDPGQNLKR